MVKSEKKRKAVRQGKLAGKRSREGPKTVKPAVLL